MTKLTRFFLLVAVFLPCASSTLNSQTPPATNKLKDEMRMPWERGDERFLRGWLVAGPFPGGLDTNCLPGGAGEADAQPMDGMEVKLPDGTSVKWHPQRSWGDVVGFDDLTGPKDEAIACAFTKVLRPAAGKALLSVGSGDGVRVWLNGKLVLSKDALRSLTLDEDQVEVEMNAGENALLVKVSALRSYEVRCSTRTYKGLLYITHLPWYKGDSLTKARELAAAAAKADVSMPEGFTVKMLAEMVGDRLGTKLSEAKGNPWEKIHSPLMEYSEIMLERKGQTGRIRPSGFVRLAYRDEVDGSPQFCRAYLPAGYDPAKKWPLVIQIHGYNGLNPVYVRWWRASARHAEIGTEFSNHQGVIYIEPHGRGNTSYLGMGDSDVMHAIAEAKRRFSIDADRIYLTGDSMGGGAPGMCRPATRTFSRRLRPCSEGQTTIPGRLRKTSPA